MNMSSYYIHFSFCFHFLWLCFRYIIFGTPRILNKSYFMREGVVNNVLRYNLLCGVVYPKRNYFSILYVFRKKKKQRRSLFIAMYSDKRVSLRHMNTVYDRLFCILIPNAE